MKDRRFKFISSCHSSPYEVRPYRPFTRGEEDVVPLWHLHFPLSGSLDGREEYCQVNSFDSFSDGSTVQTEIDKMWEIEEHQDGDDEVHSEMAGEGCIRGSNGERGGPESVRSSPSTNHEAITKSEQEINVSEDISQYRPLSVCLSSEDHNDVEITTDTASCIDLSTSLGTPAASPKASAVDRTDLTHSRGVNSIAGVGTQRFQHRIRSTGVDIVWFLSKGSTPISSPPPPPTSTKPGYLRIHEVLGHSAQIWMKNTENVWVDVSIGVAHPYLSTHCLTLLPNGSPSWVTKKTVTTYKGRAKASSLPDAQSLI
ncbi:hypothetical protein OF83DRAFT_1172725 [Amylostereum chailletii]|nr:hypothetical protein OF83DRAFT_1172725 [Amylostereum chailletii]